jgi:hypothetical protein
MQIGQREEQQGEGEQKRPIEEEESSAYSLFVYAIRSQITRYYII